MTKFLTLQVTPRAAKVIKGALVGRHFVLAQAKRLVEAGGRTEYNESKIERETLSDCIVEINRQLHNMGEE